MCFESMRNEIRRLHGVCREYNADIEELQNEIERLRQENKELRKKLGLPERKEEND